jgi:L-arabinose isomerase
MTAGFNEDDLIPWWIDFKGVVTTPEEIYQVLSDANNDQTCAGVITWMHTFSPSKMWIGGLDKLQKPYLHLNTQYNREIPFETIDMDFMNMNQAAHGDREHGFISARLRKRRKIIAGFWQDSEMRQRIGDWMRSAIGAAVSRQLKVARFGDNMREVAVTEGDKVEAQRVFGWSVNTFSVGGFADAVSAVTQPQIESKLAEYRSKYMINTQDDVPVRYQAKLEIALENWLVNGDFDAYTDTFEDLYHLKQLPGLASQNLMSKGYGFGAEGDWKLAALTHIIKVMSHDLAGWGKLHGRLHLSSAKRQ